MLNFKAKIFFFVCLLFTFNIALAAQPTPLYDVEVLVVDESADTRWRALKEGLNEVFIRISGDSIVMDKLKSPAASRYVKRYSYDPVENPEINEDGDLLSQRLKIQYNGTAMEKYLRDNGFPVWGEHRAEVIVWLAVRDGRNEYVLKDGDQSVIKASADAALQRRGIPDRWPLYDSKDRKILKVADIRGGFRDPVAAASKRYGRGPALAGSLIWNGRKWQSSWSLLMANGNRHWSIEDADHDLLINKAVDQAADIMGVAFAIHGIGKNQELAIVHLDIQAVDSISRYRKLENYLRELSAVESAVAIKVDAQSAVFQVTLRSTEEDFLNLIKNDAELVEAKPVKPMPVREPDISQGNEKAGMRQSDAGSEEVTGVSTDGLENNEINDQAEQSLDMTAMQPVDKPAPNIPVYHYRFIH